MSTAATLTTDTDQSSANQSDFGDWISPVIVKELRQGLRTRIFTSAFILVQVIMIFAMFVTTASSTATVQLQAFFWFCIGTTLIIVMPLRGLNALSGEMKDNTLDLIILTRMDAWRIVVGKWAAIVSQAALLTIAVVPYVILRYFLGGMNLVAELIMLVMLLFVSALLASITVGFSAFKAKFLRALIFVGGVCGGIWLVVVVIVGLATNALTFGSFDLFKDIILPLLAFIAICCFLIYYFLDMGAGRIAPLSENHSTRKRLAGLAAIILLWLLPLAGLPVEFSTAAASVIAALICIDAISETPSVMAPILRPFRWKKWAPGFYRHFLAPGWHTGIIYALIIGAITAAFLAHHYSLNDEEVVCRFIVMSAIITFPLLFTQLFFQNKSNHFQVYMVVHCICFTLTTILMIASNEFTGTKWLIWLGSPIPHVALAIGETRYSDFPMAAFLAAITLVLTIIITLFRAKPLFSSAQSIWRRILNESSPDPHSIGQSALKDQSENTPTVSKPSS